MSNHCSRKECTQNRFTEISDTEEKCIFHCEKDDWYTENSEGVKSWNEKFVKKFWEEIREKMEREKNNKCFIHNFNFFIFPEFEDKDKRSVNQNGERRSVNQNGERKTAIKDSLFWQRGEKLVFNKEVTFNNCLFKGDSYFDNIIFKRESSFTKLFLTILLFFLTLNLKSILISQVQYLKEIYSLNL